MNGHMDTNESNPDPVKVPKRVWRRHSAEFKARVIALARQPNTSVAGVALANGINANMLRNWVRASCAANPDQAGRCAPDKSKALSFVQLPISTDKPLSSPASAAKTLAPPLSSSPPVSPPSTIEVQIHRGETKVVVSLPLMSASAAWIREVLG